MNISLADMSRYILIITAIIAVLYYKRYKHTSLRYLPYYLWYAVVLEVVANELYIRQMYNVWWYNIGINIEILFYLYLFYQYVANRNTKAFILIGGIIYEAYFLINYLLLSASWNTNQTYPFVVGSILVILVVFLFLIEMFQSDKVLYVGKYLIFWIGLGLLFYNIIPLPFLIGKTFFSQHGLSRELKLYMFNIQFASNILMYFSFIYGFIWSSMTYKSS